MNIGEMSEESIREIGAQFYNDLARMWEQNPPSPGGVFALNKGQYLAGFVAGFLEGARMARIAE